MWRNGMPVTFGCSRVKEKIPKLGCIRNFGNLETQPFFSSTTQVFPIKNKTPEKLSCQKVVQFTCECFQLYTSFLVSPHAHLTLQKSKVQNETMSAALSGKTGNKQKVPNLERQSKGVDLTKEWCHFDGQDNLSYMQDYNQGDWQVCICHFKHFKQI